METVIAVTNLGKTFDGLAAVAGLSFEVRRGEIFGIIGPDGSGKTTILRMLAGIMLPTAGEAFVLGMRLPQEAEGVKEHIGYMSQRFNLYADLTVEENVRFFADIFLIDRPTLASRTEPLLRMTRLGAFKDRRAGDLSGGMKQKLALICTLIHRPALLILDEPTTGVDPVSRREFWEMLHHILREGVSMVISTPYMDEAEWCTRVGLMFDGTLISCGSPKQLKEGFEGVVAEVTPLRKGIDVKTFPGSDGIEDAQVFGDTWRVVLRDEAALARLAAGAGGAAAVRRVLPSVEDVFVHRMGRRSAGPKEGT